MICASESALMKPTPYRLNTAGAIVQDEAVFDALSQGRVVPPALSGLGS